MGLFSGVKFFCTICGEAAGKCGCWTKCSKCGWSFETGTECRNPTHRLEAMAKDAGEAVARSVALQMRDMYPEPMKHASGGFRKTLIGINSYEIQEMILAILKEYDRAAAEPPKALGHRHPAPAESKGEA